MGRRLANKRRRTLPRMTELGKRSYSSPKEKIDEYQRIIKDNSYIDHAIEKIAAELTHFLLR